MTMNDKTAILLVAVFFLEIVSFAHAQQPAKVPRLGILLYSTPEGDPSVAAFRQSLRDLGYIEGKNLSMDYRFAGGKPERLTEAAADLVRLNPDVIFAVGGDVVPAAQKATKTIPIVMWISNDPVQTGIVASLAHPGGNITGITLILDELAGKRLALLKEVAPKISRVAVLWNPDHADPEFREIQSAAQAMKVRLQSLQVRRGEDFDAQFHAATKAKSQALIVVSSRLINFQRQRILDYAGKSRMPLVGDWGSWAPDGALLSYGPNIAEMMRRVAVHVDKILKGTKPTDIPVERPTKFELIINLNAAKAVGLTVPPNVLVRADKVIK
jgi:putative tryptophan/tyrosine transport system substrate-binding protein